MSILQYALDMQCEYIGASIDLKCKKCCQDLQTYNLLWSVLKTRRVSSKRTIVGAKAFKLFPGSLDANGLLLLGLTIVLLLSIVKSSRH